MLMFNAYHGIANFVFKICHSLYLVQYHLYYTLFMWSSFNQRIFWLYGFFLLLLFMHILNQEFISNQFLGQRTCQYLFYLYLINIILGIFILSHTKTANPITYSFSVMHTICTQLYNNEYLSNCSVIYGYKYWFPLHCFNLICIFVWWMPTTKQFRIAKISVD